VGHEESVVPRALRAIALILLAGGLLEGCGTRHEVSRSASPDGALDAVLTEIVGAPTAHSYEVYVVRRGATLGRSPAVMSLEGVRRSEHEPGANLRWLAPGELAVEYLSAKAVTLKASETRLGERSVRILSRAGVTDTAPAEEADAHGRPGGSGLGHP